MDQSQEDTHLLATLAQYADMTARAPLLKYKALCCIPKSECKGASSSVTFKYLAEGAANVVFSIHPWTPSDGNPFLFVDLDARSDPSRPKHAVLPRNPFLNKVIRISKGVPKSLNSQTIIEGFAKDVKPLFQSARARIHDEYEEDRKSRPPPRWNMWDHDRRARTLNPFANPYYRDSYVEAQLPKPSLPDVPLPGDESFEEHLMDHEGLLLSAPALQELLSLVPRAERQRISVSPTQTPQWGILLPNMSSVPEKSVTLEIKPKWLVQSPNAPRDAYRCRNCALRASRVAQNKELSEEKGGYLCPLKLLRGERKVIQAWVRSKVEKAFEEHTPDNQLVESITERTTDYLIAGKGHQLLAHIGHLQTHLDRRGVLCNPDGPDHREIEHRLRLAMTLRDCSLYIKIPYGRYSDVEITSKLGDLDFKSPEKVSDWAQKEESLRNGGWYTSLTQLEGLNCLISQAWKREVPY